MVNRDKKYSLEQHLINDILMEWNPLGISGPILSEEYRGYIPAIINVGNEYDKILFLLEDILVNHLGLDYNPNDMAQKKDVLDVTEKILSLYK